MEQIDIARKIAVLGTLAQQLKEKNQESNEVYLYAKAKNPWFTLDFIITSFNALIDYYLNQEALSNWLANYQPTTNTSKKVGIIVAGNIPLVGIHDVLCAYFSNHQILLKFSSKDDVLMDYVIKEWALIDAQLMQQFTITESLKNIDAIIATGSNTTHKYFEYYFKDIPKILRKNRNSIAVLTGQETAEELQLLSDDIFLYFGLGCRNVSCILVPESYDITQLFPYYEKYNYMKNHVKYMNNYDYNRTLLLMNQLPHLSNDYVIMEENGQLSSRLATIHYIKYQQLEDVNQFISLNLEAIQCIVSSADGLKYPIIPFGESQFPTLNQYADNIDTLQFLINL